MRLSRTSAGRWLETAGMATEHNGSHFVVVALKREWTGRTPGGSEMSDEDDLRAEIERLRAKVEVLQANNKDRIRLQVSVKGALSLYGSAASRSRSTRTSGRRSSKRAARSAASSQSTPRSSSARAHERAPARLAVTMVPGPMNAAGDQQARSESERCLRFVPGFRPGRPRGTRPGTRHRRGAPCLTSAVDHRWVPNLCCELLRN